MNPGQQNTVSGFLSEKNGRYYMVLTLKDLKTGKFKPKWIATGLTTKGNKKRAETMLMETRKKYTELAAFPKDQSLFSDYIERWLKIMCAELDPSTVLSYSYIINNSIAPYFRERGVLTVDLTPKDIKGYYDFLMAEKGLAASTVRRHHANIRKCLQKAVMEEIIMRNPADLVVKPKTKPFITTYYDAELLKQLFQLLRGHRLELPVLVASYYGMRRSEVLGLRWSAVNFRTKTISVNHTVSLGLDENGNRAVIKKDRAKNKSSLRTLPLLPEIEEALATQRRRQRDYMKVCGNCYKVDHLNYIFTDELGELMKLGYITQAFSDFLKKHDMPKIRFHDLRHSCASLLLAADVPLKEIQIWLGHSDFSTTANIYAHVDTSSKQHSADKISMLLTRDAKPVSPDNSKKVDQTIIQTSGETLCNDNLIHSGNGAGGGTRTHT